MLCDIFRFSPEISAANLFNVPKLQKPIDKRKITWYNIKAVKKSCGAVGNFRGVAQFGRVLALGARCRRFESCRLDQYDPQRRVS